MSDQIPAAQSLHLLRRQRHSFLNHLQVISGWLQLERPDKARQYLEAVAVRMAGESDVLRQAPSALGLLMLELGMEAETYGVHLQWRVDGPDISLPDGQQLDQLRREVVAAMAAGQSRVISVSLAADGFSVHTPSGKGEG
ncbi:MAG TPA: Spo0B domain-containing protein [Symbiobacteriaceae bacterium]|nr:Spo0B domain-containing protein [Symbiobacteriaceae bacterium]